MKTKNIEKGNKKKPVTVRFTDEEMEDLRRIAKFSDATAAQIVRMIFRLKIVEWKGKKFSEIYQNLKNHNSYGKQHPDGKF